MTDSYRKNVFTAIILIILIGGSFAAGKASGRDGYESSVSSSLQNTELGRPEGVDFSPFWKAWSVINEKYVPASTSTAVAVDDQEKVWGAIEGLAQSLGDPYTVFLPPVENEIFEGDVRGNFEGVGMEVGVRDGVLTVVAPLKGTPAYNAGIKSGDRIVEINDTSTYNMSTDEAVSLIRGKKGTEVSFAVIREGTSEPIEVTVVRDVINIPTIETEMRSDGVFVIELYNFSAASPDLFRAALREFIEARTDKLVLDLRGNPGGYLEAAIDMASWFLPPGKIVVREDFGDKQAEEVYRSRGYDIFNKNLKMVILVDNGSASASEILAGALQEHDVAKLVGTQTYGKGSVQELVKITPETSLKVTIARWLTPEGVSISASGVTPDFVVENIEEDILKGIDAQKDKAVEVLKNWPQN
jgi:carboxyl-terminal processing protease